MLPTLRFRRQMTQLTTIRRVASMYFRTVVEPSEEVVEDSEPERLEARRVERLRKKAQKKMSKITTDSSRASVNGNVDGSWPSNLPSQVKMATAAITDENDVHGSTSIGPPPAEAGPSMSLEAGAAGPQDAQTSKILNLTKFAYAPIAGPSRQASHTYSRIASRTPSEVSPYPDIEIVPMQRLESTSIPKARKSRLKPTKPVTSSDARLDTSNILRCPTCQVSWTARKSVSAKLEHITKCAKKHGVALDDLRHRLDAEAAKTPRVSRSKKVVALQAAALVPVRSEPQTYLQDVVEGAAPRKRKPRQAAIVPGTVQPLADTRSTILDRAKALLVESPFSEGSTYRTSDCETDGGSMTAVLSEASGQGNAPPATQQFTTSKLARAFIRPEYDSNELEGTQEPQFPLSANPARVGTSDVFAYFAHYDSSPEESTWPRDPMSIAASSSKSCLVKPPADLKGKMRAPSVEISDDDASSTKSIKRSQLPLSTPIWRGKTASNTSLASAFKQRLVIVGSEKGEQKDELDKSNWSDTSRPNLTWDANPGEPSSSTQNAPFRDGNPSVDLEYLQQWTSHSPSAHETQHSASESSILVTKVKRFSKLTPSTPRGGSKAVKPKRRVVADPVIRNSVTDQDLFNGFRATIYQNEVLHSKILRYEPISFDYILAEVGAAGIKSKHLRPKLKTFLDASCVNHFGGEGSWGR
ncbi:hypothetical protein FRB94_008103 [Tulasnella sp. JGI-2019a]|nr:hypothetical protein FRB94_008103 [Tulasnella sp. JGI-2019a]